MIGASKHPYRFFPSEPGMFVEIYLPKKAHFQGKLYDALTDGFHLEKVKEHFKDVEKKPKIMELMKQHKSISSYTDEMIDNLPQVFFGYSMYEADGVFYSRKKDIIQEERTQIIRIMFIPNIDHIIDKHPNEERKIESVIREYLRCHARRDDYTRERKFDNIELEVIEYLQGWVDYIALFLFGYIVFGICERIANLCLDGEMDWKQAEDEILVTSFWDLVINHVKFTSDSNWTT